MHTPPPDWNEDKKLWDLMAHAPTEQAGSNFLFLVRQKLQPSIRNKTSVPQFSWFQGWIGGLSVAAACLILLAVLLPHSKFENRSSLASNRNANNVELASLAQHYELIQDLDVIERLDEL